MIKYDIKKISEKNIRMIPRKMVEISEQINKITAKMKGRIEKEIPDTWSGVRLAHPWLSGRL